LTEYQAIIPAAGIGTRLKPHTHTIPKALIRVAGKPILGFILDDVVRAGIRNVTLVTGFFAEKVEDYVRARPSSSAWATPSGPPSAKSATSPAWSSSATPSSRPTSPPSSTSPTTSSPSPPPTTPGASA
jgi:NDP-sugar pyrophosphorylase family protein